MKQELAAMVAAVALELCPVEQARQRFLQKLAAYPWCQPKPGWLRRLEEVERHRQRHRIRKVVRRHQRRRRW